MTDRRTPEERAATGPMPIGPLSQDVVRNWLNLSFQAAQAWLEEQVAAGRLKWTRKPYIADWIEKPEVPEVKPD